jgi:hypothetical protein
MTGKDRPKLKTHGLSRGALIKAVTQVPRRGRTQVAERRRPLGARVRYAIIDRKRRIANDD